MKNSWSTKIDNILKVGIPLSEMGVSNWALRKKDALNALNEFEKLKIAILGGDVCKLINNKIQYSYDSWYCEQMPNESDSDFFIRSISKAKNYIDEYHCNDMERTLFSFVPKLQNII